MTAISSTDLTAVPEPRAAALRPVLARLDGASQVVLTTHVNADGDGAGSEAAVAAWLESRGKRVTIVNPTPFPALFRFLLHRDDVVADLAEAAGDRALAEADLFLVLDTSEEKRVAPLADRLPRERTLVVDHHPEGPDTVGSLAVQDPSAAATGELAYDMVRLSGDPLTAQMAIGMYVALLTDTGSFRFANTSPRVHAVVAELMACGIDPEAVYRRLFATYPRSRLELLRESLGTLRTDEEHPVSWMVISNAVAEATRAEAEDFDGLIEHARSIEGTEVALLFREMPDGTTKISFRSNGGADVNRVARKFGGGGHVKASGALVEGRPEQVVPEVLEVVRAALRELPASGA